MCAGPMKRDLSVCFLKRLNQLIGYTEVTRVKSKVTCVKLYPSTT